MESFEIGDIVTGIYKTGKYIGEITELKRDRYLMRVLAVMKHPKQGDLHQPKSADVPFFHERRALAYREQTNIPAPYVKKYEGDLPDYKASLRSALDDEIATLEQENSDWSHMALEKLRSLEADYFK
ncbi:MULTISPECIES: kinase-associated lipoprotein B [Bacillaceae]|uniref:Kinase-associated lipoprotein B n=1 Tax=Evansella alkalicola TaxID=745819 RepID=A0ABS6JSI5_9BACI|nr:MULTISPECIES: kinase-associated lipoprotein B [Bacillaceae]MBU9721458.1 kinase-associated lipoprotein B [Bacillus alkalicola]